MKRLLLLLFCWPILAFSQRLPSVDFDKVRITLADRVIQAEIMRKPLSAKAKPNLYYYWYRANAIHTTQGGFIGKLLDGSYKEFYMNKNLKEQGFYKKGLKNGEWKSWNEQGHLVSSYTWHNGIRSGKFVVYNDDGQPVTEGTYKNDLLNGPVKNYHSVDSVELTTYKNGKVVPLKHDSSSFWRKLNIFKKN